MSSSLLCCGAGLFNSRQCSSKIKVLVDGALNDTRQLWIAKALPPRIESWCGQRRLSGFYRWCAMKRLDLRGGSLVSRTDGTPDQKERDHGEHCKNGRSCLALRRSAVGWALKFRHAARSLITLKMSIDI